MKTVIPSILPPHRTYYDPSLWMRLIPRIEERQVELMLHMSDGRWKTEAEARQMVGELHGLKWVMEQAKELTKIEDRE